MKDLVEVIALWLLILLVVFLVVALGGKQITWEYDGRWHSFQMRQGEQVPK